LRILAKRAWGHDRMSAPAAPAGIPGKVTSGSSRGHVVSMQMIAPSAFSQRSAIYQWTCRPSLFVFSLCCQPIRASSTSAVALPNLSGATSPRHRSGATPYRGQLDPNGSLQLLGVLPVSRVLDNVTLPSSEREIPPPETSALFPTMNELLKVPCGSSNPT
jgi:hypothetical protein